MADEHDDAIEPGTRSAGAEGEPAAVEAPPPFPLLIPPVPPVPDVTVQGTAYAEPPGRRRSRVLLIALAVVVVVAGGAAGVLAFAFRGSNDVLTKMVPNDADVYGTVYLDPALGQKLALRDLIRKFPATATDAKLDEQLDRFFDADLQGTGLSFSKDVRPWIGSQIAVVGKVGDTGSGGIAVLVASKDDAAAQAALAKLRIGLAGTGTTWATQHHGGITISVGSSGAAGTSYVYAFVSHTVVIGSAAEIVDEVIDTTQGSRPAISTSSEYAKVFDALPKDKLAFVFVNAGPLVKELETTLGQQSLVGPGSFATLDAYRGAGIAVSATSDGIAADFTLDVDPSKLTADERQALAINPHPNAVLAFTPQDAYALFASEGLQQSARQFVSESVKADPATQQTLDRYGLTGPDNVIDHLTGDGGITAGPGATPGAFPGIAAIVGTDDPAGMQRFLEVAALDVADALAGPGSTWLTQDYRGVTISYLPLPPDSFVPVSPAYAVGEGMAIVADSPEEVKAILDAHAGSNVSTTSNYTTAIASAQPGATNIFYLNVEAIAAAVREQLPPDEQVSYDGEVAPNLSHVKAFVLSATSTADSRSFRMFVLIR